MGTVRKEIEDEINKHAQAIVSLRRRLNATTTVARLLPELLSEIFIHVARDSYENAQRLSIYTYSSRTTAWITVAQVCHSWRQVALSSPRMWSHLVLVGKRSADELLLRSKKAPLRIVAILTALDNERCKVLENILDRESERVKELYLTGTPRLLQNACKKISQPAVLLETLVLSQTYPPSTDEGLPPIPQTLSPHLLPRLRSLELRRLRFKWDHPILCTSLTTLVIHGRMGSMVGTFEHLLSAVEGMPDLEVLELDGVIPPLPADAIAIPACSRKIPLPHLQYISLSDSPLDCANLLNHFVLSTTPRLKLVARGAPKNAAFFTQIREQLSRAPSLQTLLIEHSLTDRILTGWRTLIEVDPTDPTMSSDSSGCDLRLETNRNTLLVPQLIVGGDVAHFGSILRLEVRSGRGGFDWASIFKAMPLIRVLSVQDSQLRQVTDGLSSVLDQDGSHPMVVLPYLHTLVLHDIRLCEPHDPELLDELVDCLIERCNYGVAVQELHLSSCINTGPEEVDRLREIVPEVTWDGIQDYDELIEDEDDDMDGEYLFDNVYGELLYDHDLDLDDYNDLLPIYDFW